MLKNNNFKKIILLFFIIFNFGYLTGGLTYAMKDGSFYSADALSSTSPGDYVSVKPYTSGILYIYYEIKLCSPHSGEFSKTHTFTDCETKGHFYDEGGIGTLTYGVNKFINGNVVINNNKDELKKTQGGNNEDISLFKGITNLRIDGEGIYKMRVLLLDNAGNSYVYDFEYKIDKTAPQFFIDKLSENSDLLHVSLDDENLNIEHTAKKFDSSNKNLGIGESKFPKPYINTYEGIKPKISINKRSMIRTIYFKDANDDEDFEITVKADNFYSPFLKQGSMSDLDHIEFRDESVTDDPATDKDEKVLDKIQLSDSEKNGFTKTISKKSKLFKYIKINSQAVLSLRLYDKAGNYSEAVYYVVRDNTKPNMGGNGLAGNDSKEAINRLLKFNNSTTVWDDNTPLHNVSKFISATSKQKLISNISDIGITGSGKTTGTNINYKAFNAGLNTDNIIINIEKTDDKNSFEQLIKMDQRYENFQKSEKDFSKVDNDRAYGQRKYSVEFKSYNGPISGTGEICDLVGNCLKPKLEFRVVANNLDIDNSTITLETSGKIFADAESKYIITTKLKDLYNNYIVGVKAVENGNKIIKKISNKFNFENELFYDQINLNGEKGAVVSDNNNDSSGFDDEINGVQKDILLSEKIEGAIMNGSGGIFSFNLSSAVPTYGTYNYLGSGSILELSSISPNAKVGDVSNVGIYPDTDSGLGLFNYNPQNKIKLDGSDNFTASNTDFFKKTDYTTDIDIDKKSIYGKVEIIDGTNQKFSSLNNRKMNFDFSAPLVISGSGFTINHLVNNIGQSASHIKKSYIFGEKNNIKNGKFHDKYLPSYTSSSVIQKKFTPDIFNIKKWESNDTWDTINDLNSVNVNLLRESFGGKNYKIKSTPVESSYQIQNNVFNMGYVSYLTYEIGGKEIKIPSLSRNMSSYPANPNYSKEEGSLFYFNNNNYGYNISKDKIINTGISGSMGIALTGISNSVNTMTVDDIKGTKANINLSNNITKYNGIKLFKKNVQKRSAGITWCKSSDFGGEIGEDELNNKSGNLLESCTTVLHGETISFIEGNLNISCNYSSTNVCYINNNLRRSIIIKHGSTYIDSNISSYGTNGKLLIGTLEYGLKNIDISEGDNIKLNRDNKLNGWIFVNTEVTNIDGFIVSEGPILSGTLNGDKINLYNSPDSSELKNQLHIHGSLISLNTIGGYKSDSDSKCPYVIKGNCSSKKAFLFDLVTLRRYSLVGESAGSLEVIPSGGGFRSGKNDSPLITTFVNDVIDTIQVDSIGKDGLRFITDQDYIIYPLFVEKDNSWKISPSVLFEN